MKGEVAPLVHLLLHQHPPGLLLLRRLRLLAAWLHLLWRIHRPPLQLHLLPGPPPAAAQLLLLPPPL
jgi:hypothetical protein